MSTDGPIAYLSRPDIASVALKYSEGVELIAAGLTEKANGRVENPPKPGIHPQPHAFIHAMPAYIPELGVAGLKWVSGFPDNPANGMPYISGLIILNDPQTGLPTAIMDASWVTAFRTACVSGLALQYLSLRPLRTAAIIGCGTQGRAHVEMLLELFPSLEELRLFDIFPGAAEAAKSESRAPDICRVASSLREAAEGTQAIITAVAERDEGPAGAIQPEWLIEGCLMLPLANDFGWSRGALGLANRLYVDDIAQFRHFRSIGELERSDDLPEPKEFASLLAAGVTEREPTERICSLNIGLALHDVILGQRMMSEAQARGLGVSLAR